MSFLPMEDELSSVRRSVYGVSIEDIKPYRQTVPLEAEDASSAYTFGSKDILLFLMLLGVYVVFVQKRGRTRSVSF